MSYIKNWVSDPQKKWSVDLNSNQYYLVLTNDMDSYISCQMLRKKFGIEIGGFYDFHGLYINPEITAGKEPVFVDCDLAEGKCYGNHVQYFDNPQAINLNETISNYTDKYAGSTLMMVCSLYDVDIKRYPDDTALFFLLIDGWYMQYYCFQRQWLYWAKELKVDWLEYLLKKSNKEKCSKMATKYQTFAKIKINKDGYIYTDFDFQKVADDLNLHITTPERLFFPVQTQWLRTKQEDCAKPSIPLNKIFSAVKPRANTITYSY